MSRHFRYHNSQQNYPSPCEHYTTTRLVLPFLPRLPSVLSGEAASAHWTHLAVYPQYQITVYYAPHSSSPADGPVGKIMISQATPRNLP